MKERDVVRHLVFAYIKGKSERINMNVEKCREAILSEDYRDFIVGNLQEKEFVQKFPNVLCKEKMGEFYQTFYVGGEEADPMRFDKYPYNSIPKCYTLLDVEAMSDAGIVQVQNYPRLELQGTGVLIGFVDTGIDYQNPVFQNLDGSSRIVGIWDQTVQEGTPPQGMFYGSEYRKDIIDEALRSENPLALVPTVDVESHGTYLASVAAGGVSEEQRFLGAAPDAMIAMVKLKPAKQYLRDFYLIHTQEACYQENDIMLGIVYLNELANEMGVPLVLCVALGTNMGSHAAGSPLVGFLDTYANTANRTIVIGAGNEADRRHHFLGESKNIGEEKQVEIRVGSGNLGFCTEIWSNAFNLFAVSVVSPSGERSYQFPIRSEQTQEYQFLFEKTKITIDYKVFVERLNATLIFLRIEGPAEGIWKVIVEPIQVEDGVFHLWLPVQEFLQSDVYFLEPNPNYTITEPGSSLAGITVGFYNGKDNSVAIPSGRGYTRSERIKPDLVAPGVDVLGAILRNRFVTRTGSSVATGIASGAAALMMEWVVYDVGREDVDSTQIRNLLILGTEKTPNEIYPNRLSGYGRLNLYHSFEAIRQI